LKNNPKLRNKIVNHDTKRKGRRISKILYRIDTYVAIADNKNIPNVKYWRDVKIKIKAIK